MSYRLEMVIVIVMIIVVVLLLLLCPYCYISFCICIIIVVFIVWITIDNLLAERPSERACRNSNTRAQKRKREKNDQDFFRVLESPPMPKTRRFKEHRVRRGKDRKAIEIDSTCGEIER